MNGGQDGGVPRLRTEPFCASPASPLVVVLLQRVHLLRTYFPMTRPHTPHYRTPPNYGAPPHLATIGFCVAVLVTACVWAARLGTGECVWNLGTLVPLSSGADAGGTHVEAGSLHRRHTLRSSCGIHTLKRNGVAACSGNTLPWKRLGRGGRGTPLYQVHVDPWNGTLRSRGGTSAAVRLREPVWTHLLG